MPRYAVDYRNLFWYKPHSQYFTTMSPDEFLALAARRVVTTKESKKKLVYSKASIERVKKRMLARKVIDALYLDVDSSNCEIDGHEGRHRAIAAKQLGIHKLPVILYCKHQGRSTDVRDCDRCFRKPGRWTDRLKSQDWAERAKDVVLEAAYV